MDRGAVLASTLAAFKRAAAHASVTGATFLESSDTLCKFLVSFSQRDLTRMVSRKFIKCFAAFSGGPATSFPLPLDMEGVTNYTFNESGRKVALARSVVPKDGNKDKTEVFVEVWEDGMLRRTIRAAGKHGPIYDNDNVFAGFKWCSDDRRLVYAAEKFEPEIVGFFDPPKPAAASGSSALAGNGSVSTDAALPMPGSKHVRRESWGEGFPSCFSPIVVILDTETEDFSFPLSTRTDESVSWGAPTWTPDGSGLVVVGWPYEHRKLGLKFCLNRASAVYHVALDPHLVLQLSQPSVGARAPLFSPGGTNLVWIENDVGGPHASGSRLVRCAWSGEAASAVVRPVLPVPQFADDLGVYGARLPAQCFVDESTLVFTTYFRSTRVAVRVDLEAGTITRMAVASEPAPAKPTGGKSESSPAAGFRPAPQLPLSGVVDVLAVSGARALVAVSSPASPHTACLATIDGNTLTLMPLSQPVFDPSERNCEGGGVSCVVGCACMRP
jgi:acylaminoacyl-peptidase